MLKRVVLALVGALLLFAHPHEARAQFSAINCALSTPCNLSSGPSNTGAGDPLWKVGGKVNTQLAQLYNMFGVSTHLATSGTVTAADLVGLFGSCTGSAILLGSDGACHPGAPASGTSGGVVYWSSTTALSSSAALTAGEVVVGGGPGAAPVTLTPGTAHQLLHGGTSQAFGAIDLANDSFSNFLGDAFGGTGFSNSFGIQILNTNAIWNGSPSGNVGTRELGACNSGSPITATTTLTLVANGANCVMQCTAACTITVPNASSSPAVTYPQNTCIFFYAKSGSAVTISTADTLSYITASGALTGARTMTPPATLAICRDTTSSWFGGSGGIS